MYNVYICYKLYKEIDIVSSYYNYVHIFMRYPVHSSMALHTSLKLIEK